MEDVHWLDDEELETWMVFVAMAMRLPALLDRQLQQDAGLSHFDYGILSNLSEAPDHTRHMSSLAGFANGSLSRLSHAVKRLEDRGWVHREPCPEDGRQTDAILTKAGWDKVVATSPGHVREVRKLVIDALTPEQLVQLRAIGRSILERVDEAGDASCPPHSHRAL